MVEMDVILFISLSNHNISVWNNLIFLNL